VEAHTAEGSVSFILPNLSERIVWYQDRLRPEDPKFGAGIADWTITSEYAPSLKMNGAPIWGMMGGPPDALMKLTPEDIEARRAHIVIRTPTNADELAEVERTLFHELGHVLHAKLNLPRKEEEEIMHSLDHVFSKLSPEQATALARSFSDPMARAYRAETTAMPDPIEDKDKPDKEAPKMAEGAPRDIATIEAEMLKTRLAGGDIAALQDEWFAAKMAATAAAPIVEPAAPPVMGMKPEDAYARGQKAGEAAAESKAVKAYAESLEGLTPEQKVEVADAPSMARAQRLVKSYPRQAPIALPQHPAKKPGNVNEKPMARAVREASANPMLRKILGIGSIENDGVHFEPGNGILVYTDGTEQLNHQRAVYQARQDKLRGAA
jgi:hypothetical protein